MRTTMKPGSRLILLFPNPNSLWRYVLGNRWYGWDPPVHVHHYSLSALKLFLRREGFRLLALRSIRRNDSLAAALAATGLNLGRLRIFLRLLMFPIMPFLARAGLGPELLCVAEADPKRQSATTSHPC